MEAPPVCLGSSSTALCTGLCSSAGRSFAGGEKKERKKREIKLNIFGIKSLHNKSG